MPIAKHNPFLFHLTAAKLLPLRTWHAPMECIQIFWHFALLPEQKWFVTDGEGLVWWAPSNTTGTSRCFSLISSHLSLSPSSVMSDGLFPELPQVHRPSVINIQTGVYVKKLRQKHVAITSSRSGLMVQEHLHSQCQWLVTEAVWMQSQNM